MPHLGDREQVGEVTSREVVGECPACGVEIMAYGTWMREKRQQDTGLCSACHHAEHSRREREAVRAVRRAMRGTMSAPVRRSLPTREERP